MKRLQDKNNWRTRYDAAIALGKMGKEAAPAVKALTKTLEDSDYDVREQSAKAPRQAASVHGLFQIRPSVRRRPRFRFWAPLRHSNRL